MSAYPARGKRGRMAVTVGFHGICGFDLLARGTFRVDAVGAVTDFSEDHMTTIRALFA